MGDGVAVGIGVGGGVGVGLGVATTTLAVGVGLGTMTGLSESIGVTFIEGVGKTFSAVGITIGAGDIPEELGIGVPMVLGIEDSWVGSIKSTS
jgi:hypothetical protein